MFGYAMTVAGDARVVADLREWLSARADTSPAADRWSWVGFSASLDLLDDELSFEVAADALGRRPLADVWFSIDNKVDEPTYEDADRRMWITAARFVVELDLEAVWAFQGEVVVMRRRGGTLVLYDEWPEWSDPVVIEGIGVPFERTSVRETF